MPITERDKRRLDALIAIVKPANSLAARIDTLSDNQRDWFRARNAHCKKWLLKNDDEQGRAYRLTLDGYGPFGLREDISVALFGPAPQILTTDDEQTSAQKYRTHLDGHG